MSNLSGGNRKVFVSNAASIVSMSIDVDLNRLYFGSNAQIERVNLDGTGRTTITVLTNDLTALTVFEKYLYIVDGSRDKIYQLDKFTGLATKQGPKTLKNFGVNDIKAYHALKQNVNPGIGLKY